MVFAFFIDDFFHSLSVGAICRPVTDRFQISAPSWPICWTPPPRRSAC
jgi:Na+/H+ antiporter NhaC